MDKIKTVKIKNPNGSVSEETYTIAVDARNVDMENGKELQETIGTINIDNDGDISNQLKNLKSNKINKIDIIDNLESNDKNKVLSANQGKEINDKLKKKPYYYNNVAEMKADKKLKAGDMAVTLGYYEINDDGSANYYISSNKPIVGYYETLNNGNYAILINGDNVKQFGCYGDNIHNDTANFMKAINNINGIVYVPYGTYLIDNIILNENSKLIGYNENKCVINCTENNNFITIKDKTVKNILIKNLTINGKDMTNIIYLNINETTSEPFYSELSNLRINKGNYGIYLGNRIIGINVNNIKMKENNYGIYLKQCTDSNFTFIDIQKSKVCGIYGTVYSSKFSNIKVWTSYGNGYEINAGSNLLSNCEAQEIVGHGFVFTQGSNLIANNLVSDRVGTNNDFTSPTDKSKYNFHITGITNLILSCECADFRSNEFGVSELGCIYLKNSAHVNINCIISPDNTSTPLTREGSTYNNNIIINNNQYLDQNYTINNENTPTSITKSYVMNDNNYKVSVDNRFRILKDNNAHITINNDLLSLGAYQNKLTFFSGTGVTKRTVSGQATDLDSTMALVNAIYTALHEYNLI